MVRGEPRPRWVKSTEAAGRTAPSMLGTPARPLLEARRAATMVLDAMGAGQLRGRGLGGLDRWGVVVADFLRG